MTGSTGSDSYRVARFQPAVVTDDVAVADDAEPETDGTVDEGVSDVDFEDLSLPQRVFVAAVQNPTRGVIVLGLIAFAFSFYVAFWLVFPRIAGFLTALTLIVGLVLAGIYYAIDRLR